MAETLKQTITDAVLRRMAGEQSYRRGVDYFAHGHVESLDEDESGVEASVRGTQDYRVTLTLDEGVLDYDCDCPIGAEGTFCKHCVAAALAWRQQVAGESKARSKAKPLTLAEAAKLLERESAASIWASRSNRAMYWESPDSAAGSTLIATSRFSLPSRAR
ncbi:MAG: SWIM zinc finger family protein [Bryobacteraceae bacterium]